MKLRDATQTILTEAEELSGTPVEIIRDPELSYFAWITRARAGVPAHILRINPTKGDPDYLVAYECGFMLRVYWTPSDERHEFSANSHGWDSVVKLVGPSGYSWRTFPTQQSESEHDVHLRVGGHQSAAPSPQVST